MLVRQVVHVDKTNHNLERSIQKKQFCPSAILPWVFLKPLVIIYRCQFRIKPNFHRWFGTKRCSERHPSLDRWFGKRASVENDF